MASAPLVSVRINRSDLFFELSDLLQLFDLFFVAIQLGLQKLDLIFNRLNDTFNLSHASALLQHLILCQRLQRRRFQQCNLKPLLLQVSSSAIAAF